MHSSRIAVLAGFGVLALSLPVFAGVTVNSPANNTDVSSPFTLSADASTCSSQNVASIGYSFDSSSNTTVYNKQSIDSSIDVSTGTHTLHVKAWGSNGSSCVTDVTINVKSSASTSGSSSEVPSDAQTVSHIQALSGWQAEHDSGGPGSSSGSSAITSSPSLYGSTRRYETKFSGSGDERFSISFSDDVNSKNFFYDAWVYLTSSASQLGNIEMDVNQVMADGKTVLVGVQCDGYHGQWAYTVNTGSASNVKPHWQAKSGTSCNPRSWSRDNWHHVQFSFTRDDSGNITYQSIWLDGVESKLNEVAFGAADLGWGPAINTQFQLDGMGSGSVTAYVDNLTISRW
jgi:hypothetical protein